MTVKYFMVKRKVKGETTSTENEGVITQEEGIAKNQNAAGRREDVTMG